MDSSVSRSEMQERSRKFLEDSVGRYKIFIDTCSLLHEAAELFWENIIPELRRKNEHIIVPYRVYQEVEKYANDAELCERKQPGSNLNELAKAARHRVAKLHKEGLVVVRGEESDNFADNVFLTIFTKFRMQHDLMLITQDAKLSDDILRLSESRSVNTNKRVVVERINRYGFLSVRRAAHQDAASAAPRRQRANYSPERSATHFDEKFAVATSITDISGTIQVSEMPKESDVVIAARNGRETEVRLAGSIGSGGEGEIFETNIPNVVAKIYKRGRTDRAKLEKLKLMLTKSIDCEGICFPIAILYNKNREFVGYLMKRARGKDLQKCVFIAPRLKKNFPDWTKKDTVELCITILEKIKYLHERNIILGDINPGNILVVSPREVYFVDTDSYQIEGFPCPVGTINFTAPEIQRKDYSTFLRTIGNERFAVATLLFMIMLPGKSPYSLQGGENQIDNIINGDFAYASGERSTGKAPEGPWRFCWSHLPRSLKDDFYETFRKGGEHNAESKRYSTEEWLHKFEEYRDMLVSGKMTEYDAMSAELFPTRLKKNPYATYIRCRLCGAEVDESRTEQGICQNCLKQGEEYRCSRCRRTMIYTNYQKLIRRAPRHDMCKDCIDEIHNERNRVYTSVRCSHCGTTFSITYGEKEFFDSKGWQLPKKCKSCRDNRTPATRTAYSRPRTSGTYSPTTQPKKTVSRGFCFITTAVCEYFNKPDDCYELTTLRRFRDDWLALQPSGKELIDEYYRVAPTIVKAIDAEENRDEIYAGILTDYIEPCIKLIELTAYESCRDLYTEMVTHLKKEFVKE